jgi:anaerobic magnesium-protoporphyrin IX monomethyl ester cyclase
MADVLVTHSYHLPYDRKQVRKMQPYPPLGTLYAAAVLREAGVSVAVFDPMLAEPLDGFREALDRHRPSLVAIYEDDFNFLTKMCLTRMRELAWEIAAEAKRFGARVAVHGSDASDHVNAYLRRGCDWVLLGSSEFTLLELFRRVSTGGPSEALPGVATLGDRLDPAVEARKLAVIRRASPFPLPARDLIDLAPYREAWKKAHGTFSLNLVASRGCPYRCNWCAKPIFGDTYFSRQPAEVAEEMADLGRRYGAEHLWFADDIFAINPHWVRRFAEEVEARGCALPYKVQARADRLTGTTAEALKRSGCAEVWMGVESGSQSVLDAMEKDLQIDQIVAARENLRRQGIRACYFLQFGYPGESWSDLQKTIALVRETAPDDVGISFSYPLPNTRFYERVRAQLGEKQNWADSEDLCVMFQGAYSDAFYRAVRDALHAEVEELNGRAKPASRPSREMWNEVARLEPASRNQNPTALGARRAAGASALPWQLIPVGDVAAGTRKHR